MRANVNDWLVVKSVTYGEPEQRAIITAVHGAGGSPPYTVRWLATDRESLIVPDSNAVVVTSAEQRAADERARSRLASIRAAIFNGKFQNSCS